jgi:hypothetical protein
VVSAFWTINFDPFDGFLDWTLLVVRGEGDKEPLAWRFLFP